MNYKDKVVINNSTLYHADCLDIMEHLNYDNSVVVSDVPYNIGYHYGTYSDSMKDADYYKMLKDIL
jgi:DNA modification methylase